MLVDVQEAKTILATPVVNRQYNLELKPFLLANDRSLTGSAMNCDWMALHRGLHYLTENLAGERTSELQIC